MLLLAESPGWALVAIGAAATQNPPIVIALPLALLALAIARPATLRSRTVWMGAGAACALFAAHLLYYQIRHGMPSLLFGATSRVFPTLAELMVVPFDSNLGIVPAFPAFAAIVSVAAVVLLRRPRQLLTPDILLSIGVLPFFLVSFTQTSNVHHGGTPGLSRYGIWLVPLALPLLRAFRRAAPGWSARLGFILAIPSAIACALMFHPKHPDNYREPIWLAHVLRARHPSPTNPLPEIFAEVLWPRVDPTLPVATGSCEKVLLVGRGDAQGMWPLPCYPAEVPRECRTPGALCYANRTRDGYAFAPTRDPAGPRFKFARDRTWAREAEPFVRKILDEIGWKTMWLRDDSSIVRGSRAVEAIESLEAADRQFVVVTGTDADPEVDLRLPPRTSGELIDPETRAELGPAVIREVGPDSSGISLPANQSLVVIVLRRAPD
jgi:hypothetical protein